MAAHLASVQFAHDFRRESQTPSPGLSPHSAAGCTSLPRADFSSLRLCAPRFRGGGNVRLVFSEENTVMPSSSGTGFYKLTHLEVGNHGFGIPWIDDAAKKFLKGFRVTYLEPDQSLEVEGRNGSKVIVKATPGPILGPPWQRSEKGDLLGKERADIVIRPVIKQLLPSFTLVSGQDDVVQLAKLLQAKFVVPMKNGDLGSKGFLASIVRSKGTIESFKELFVQGNSGCSSVASDS